MRLRLRPNYPCDYSPDPEPADFEAAKALLTRTTSVYERPGPWVTDAMADFGYAETLGMPLLDGEVPLASGPATFTFSDQVCTGTLLVTSERMMSVWLDRRTNLFANTFRLHADIQGYRSLDNLGVLLAYDNDTGNTAVHPKLDRRDGRANRLALEWFYTLAAQIEATFGARHDGG